MKKLSVSLQGYLSFSLILFLVSCGTDTPQEPQNQDPVIAQIIAPTTITGGQRTTLQVEASDPDGDALTFMWEVSGGLIAGNDIEALWLAPTEPGRYTIAVTVTDGKGSIVQKSVEVVVTAPELRLGDVPIQPPDTVNFAAPVIQSLWAAPSVLTTDQTLFVTVEATDPAFGEMQYSWQVTGGQLLPAPPEPGEVEGKKMRWTPPQKPGTYTLTVLVVNNLAEESQASLSVHVLQAVAGNRPPKIQSFQVQPNPFVRGGRDTARFTVRSIDPDSDALTYFWNQPRGIMKADGERAQWTAPAPLAACCAIPYKVTVAVTVSDGKGGSDTASVQMTVVP